MHFSYLFTELISCEYYVTSEAVYRDFIEYENTQDPTVIKFYTLAPKTIRVLLSEKNETFPNYPEYPETTTSYPQPTTPTPDTTPPDFWETTAYRRPITTYQPELANGVHYEIGKNLQYYSLIQHRFH